MSRPLLFYPFILKLSLFIFPETSERENLIVIIIILRCIYYYYLLFRTGIVIRTVQKRQQPWIVNGVLERFNIKPYQIFQQCILQTRTRYLKRIAGMTMFLLFILCNPYHVTFIACHFLVWLLSHVLLVCLLLRFSYPSLRQSLQKKVNLCICCIYHCNLCYTPRLWKWTTAILPYLVQNMRL